VRHGIGLGLPVASELAGAMGGTLVVGAREGGGAAFTLSLPLAGGVDGRPSGTRGAGSAAQPVTRSIGE
jgi:signal transduction histidine kinase